jgi:putative membrane protein
LRTALALIAAGIALEVLARDLNPTFRAAAALVVVSAGICVPMIAWVDWARTERAMRQNRPLPAPTLTIAIGLTIASAGVLVVIGMLA